MKLFKPVFLEILLLLFTVTACSTIGGTAEIQPGLPDSMSTPLPPEELILGSPEAGPATPFQPAAQFLPTPHVDPGQILPLNRPQYFIDARLNFVDRTLDVSQVLVYTNRNAEKLNELLLIVDANWNEDVFDLKSLIWSDGAAVTSWHLDGGFLVVHLPEPLEPEHSISLDLEYRLVLPSKPGKLGYAARQLNLGDWYPMAAVYRPGSGWLAYPPNPVGETIVYESADYRVRIQVEKAPQNLVVAASLPADQEENVYLYSGEALRSFALSMSGGYEFLDEKVGDISVSSYFFPEDRDAGLAALKSASTALAVFSEMFGPYPHASYAVVSGNFPDGLEFDGLAFTGREYYAWYDGTEKNYLTLITIHEVAHQWWYGLVGNDQAIEPWIDEALSIYSEYLYLEVVHPELIDWWWTFRLDPFRPLTGSIYEPVYAYREYRPYVNAVYLRGSEMMHEIRKELGRDRFREALRSYANTYKTDQVVGDDLIEIFRSYSVEPLDIIFDSYFSDPQ